MDHPLILVSKISGLSSVCIYLNVEIVKLNVMGYSELIEDISKNEFYAPKSS